MLREPSGGPHRLIVRNDTNGDILFHLIPNNGGDPVLSLYVRPWSSGDVTGIGGGAYRVSFTSGLDFSRACGRFMTDEKGFTAPTPEIFPHGRDGRIVEIAVRAPDGRATPLEVVSPEAAGAGR